MTRKRDSKADAGPLNTAGNPAETPVETAQIRESQPTAANAPAVRQDGLQIDGFGLPVNGVARVTILRELDAKDPVLSPGTAKGWNEAKSGAARELTEKTYG